MTTTPTPTIEDTLHRAAKRAVLAPSIHNTQPWKLVVTRNAVEIHADRSRQLSVLDPRGRQMTISGGCAVFNARVAIAAAGREPIVERFPVAEDPDLLARVSVGAPHAWLPIAALDSAIDHRRTNRRAFADEPVPDLVVRDLIAAAQVEGARLIPLEDPEQRHIVAQLSELADRIETSDPAYAEEIVKWTTDDPRRRDGVQAASVPYRGPGAVNDDALPIRDFDPRGMGWLPPSSHSDLNQCLLLLASDDDSPMAWLRSGEALEHVWLELTRQGFAASPLSQVIEVGTAHQRLRAELRLTVHPEILLRVGRAPETVRTRRRSDSDVIVETD